MRRSWKMVMILAPLGLAWLAGVLLALRDRGAVPIADQRESLRNGTCVVDRHTGTVLGKPIGLVSSQFRGNYYLIAELGTRATREVAVSDVRVVKCRDLVTRSR